MKRTCHRVMHRSWRALVIAGWSMYPMGSWEDIAGYVASINACPKCRKEPKPPAYSPRNLMWS